MEDAALGNVRVVGPLRVGDRLLLGVRQRCRLDPGFGIFLPEPFHGQFDRALRRLIRHRNSLSEIAWVRRTDPQPPTR